MTNLTDTRTSDVEIRIATIIADCKVAGTSANETTRQVLEALTSFREKAVADMVSEFECGCSHCHDRAELVVSKFIREALTPSSPKETNK